MSLLPVYCVGKRRYGNMVDIDSNGRLCFFQTTLRLPLSFPLTTNSSQRALLQKSTSIQRKPQRNFFALSASANEDPGTPATTQVALAELPTFFERLASALMYLLPLSEGLYRMMLAVLTFSKKQSLNFLFWFHHQHRQMILSARSTVARTDLLTLETLIEMSQKMHDWLTAWINYLVNLSSPLLRYREGNFGFGWISMTLNTPEAIWQIGCLLYMSILAALAAFKLTNQSKQKNKRTFLFRKPQIVSLSYFCALLMRMSWSPMEGMSDLSLELYWLGASLLTALTTGCAFARMHSLLFMRMPKLVLFMESMAQEVTWVAQLHRSFLLLDWSLCLFSSESVENKCLRSLLLVVYWMTVTALEGAANSVKQSTLKT